MGRQGDSDVGGRRGIRVRGKMCPEDPSLHRQHLVNEGGSKIVRARGGVRNEVPRWGERGAWYRGGSAQRGTVEKGR